MSLCAYCVVHPALLLRKKRRDKINWRDGRRLTADRCIIHVQKTVGVGGGAGSLLTMAISCVHGGSAPKEEERVGSQTAEGSVWSERGRARWREGGRERRREVLSLCGGLPILRM